MWKQVQETKVQEEQKALVSSMGFIGSDCRNRHRVRLLHPPYSPEQTNYLLGCPSPLPIIFNHFHYPDNA